MFKYAKITLLTLAAFLVLGFSTTANAKPGNEAPPTVDVLVTNSVPLEALRPISSFTQTQIGKSTYNSLPPGYLHNFSLTVSASPGDICVGRASILYNDGTSDREIPIASVIATGNNASVSYDYSVPIALLEYAGTVQLQYEIIVGGGNVDWCSLAWGGIYQDLEQ